MVHGSQIPFLFPVHIYNYQGVFEQPKLTYLPSSRSRWRWWLKLESVIVYGPLLVVGCCLVVAATAACLNNFQFWSRCNSAAERHLTAFWSHAPTTATSNRPLSRWKEKSLFLEGSSGYKLSHRLQTLCHRGVTKEGSFWAAGLPRPGGSYDWLLLVLAGRKQLNQLNRKNNRVKSTNKSHKLFDKRLKSLVSLICGFDFHRLIRTPSISHP